MRMFKGRFILFLALTLMLAISLAVSGCGTEDTGNDGADTKQTIVFGAFGWDSALFHNEVAAFILEQGYGYSTDAIPGETIPLMLGLRSGDIDVGMEIWVENAQEAYDKGIESGEFIDLGTNFNDNVQGMFVPTYVIEGDPDRNIEPMAPDLKTIEDLPRYWELFKDPEEPTKGRFHSAIPGWEADKILSEKFETYGLNENYKILRPGSGAALASSMVSAYEKGEPWFGYYWGPTWIFGKLDLTQIEEPAYSDELWDNGFGCEFPAVNVNIVVNHELPDKAPELIEFLTKYQTNMAVVSEALAFMQDNNAEADEAAIYFLQENEDMWTQWVPEDIAEKVKAAL